MRKVFFVCLLLVSVFLMGNAEAADGENCSLYLITVTSDNDFIGTYDECVELCFSPDGYAHADTYCGRWDDCLDFTLEDLGSDRRNLVGHSNIYGKSCHVRLRGRSLDANCLLDINGGISIRASGVLINSESSCPCENDRLM